MFARCNENPAMTLRVIKETKRYGRTDARTDRRMDGQRENSIPPTNKVCGGYNKIWPCFKLNPNFQGSKNAVKRKNIKNRKISLIRDFFLHFWEGALKAFQLGKF